MRKPVVVAALSCFILPSAFASQQLIAPRAHASQPIVVSGPAAVASADLKPIPDYVGDKKYGVSITEFTSISDDTSLELGDDNAIRVTGTVPQRCLDNGSEKASLKYEYVGGQHVVSLHLAGDCDKDASVKAGEATGYLSTIAAVHLADKDGPIVIRSYASGDPKAKSRINDEKLSKDDFVSPSTLAAQAAAAKEKNEKWKAEISEACKAHDADGFKNLLGDFSGLDEALKSYFPDQLAKEKMLAANSAEELKQALRDYRAAAKDRGLDEHDLDQLYLDQRLKLLSKEIDGIQRVAKADDEDLEAPDANDAKAMRAFKSKIRSARSKAAKSLEAFKNSLAKVERDLNDFKLELATNAMSIDGKKRDRAVYNTTKDGNSLAGLYADLANKTKESAGLDSSFWDRAVSLAKVARDLSPASVRDAYNEDIIAVYQEAADACREDQEDPQKMITCFNHFAGKADSMAASQVRSAANQYKHAKKDDKEEAYDNYVSSYKSYSSMTNGMYQSYYSTYMAAQSMATCQQQMYMVSMYNPMAAMAGCNASSMMLGNPMGSMMSPGVMNPAMMGGAYTPIMGGGISGSLF